MICVRCGHENPAESHCCHACDAVLPRLPQQEPTPAEPADYAPTDERLALLRETAESVMRGEIPVARYAATLDALLALLAEKEAALESLEIPLDALSDVEAERALGLEGIRMYVAGATTMRRFVDDPRSAHIHAGLDLVRRGNERINESLRLNHEGLRDVDEAPAPGLSTLL